MSDSPYFSIIVPVYNHEGYIGAALDSILAQTEKSWEAVVIDDGSTDGTPAIVDEYAARDARIKVAHKSNGGVASALNEGLLRASGHWVHWLSSDDLFEPDKLAINRMWIEGNPGTKFFFSYFTLLREATGQKERRELWGPVPHPEHQVLTFFYRNFVSGITICAERRAWNQIGQFDETLRYAQDYDMWLRFLQRFQGMFIPEWTVINRNHAAQGSEVFPEACYFDTAKAAIRFLNLHSFPELVPWTDFSDLGASKNAVIQALDVACEPSSFLYCMGVHPGLVLRLLEWVYSDGILDAGIASSLRQIVSQRIQSMALSEGNGAWHDMWRELAAACALPNPYFRFHSVEPAFVARREHARRRTEESDSENPLRAYLVQFEGIEVSPIKAKDAGSARIVLFSTGLDEQVSRLGRDLSELGHRPLIVISDDSLPAWSIAEGVHVLRRSPCDWNCLPWLGTADAAFGYAGETVPVWIDACSRIALETEGDCAFGAILDSLSLVRKTPQRQPVVFLQRVLVGGGAERVVRDVARHIDRRRYRPLVLTLFDGPKDPDFPSDIETFCVRTVPSGPTAEQLSQLPSDLRFEAVPSEQQPANPPVTSATTKRGCLVAAARRFYHGLLSYEQRKKLDLGHKLHGLRDRIRSAPRRLGRFATQPALKPLETEIPHTQPLPITVPSTRLTACLELFDNYWPAAEGLHNALTNLGPEAVVITVMEEAAVTAWTARQLSDFAYAASLHTVESIYLPLMYPDPLRLAVENWAFSNACLMASKITTPSTGCSNDLSIGFDVPQSQIDTVPNPVHCALIRRLAWREDQRVNEWRDTSGLRLVVVARLDENKNHLMLLQVCVRLRMAGIDFSLWILGEGPYRKVLEESVVEMSLQSNVRLLGYVENPYPFVSAADILLLSSDFESFALILIEAMICETPIISVDCVAGPREVLDDGKFGILVPPGDPDAMTKAIRRLAQDEDLRNRLVAAGLRRATDFDVSRIVPKWEQLIDTLTPAPC